MDVRIRAGLVFATAAPCYLVFAPFVTLMVWALTLAVTLYPLLQWHARKLGGRQGLAATLLALFGVLLIVVPTAVLMSSLGDSVHRLINDVQNNTLQLPAPRDSMAQWPVIGPKAYALWQAHSDLPALVRACSRRSASSRGRHSLSSQASAAGCCCSSRCSSLPASSWPSAKAARAPPRDLPAHRRRRERVGVHQAVHLATTRAVAQGVVGVPFIQSIIVGLCLLIAGVPWAGALAPIVLALGIAHVPALLVTLPAIASIWSTDEHGTGAAVLYSLLPFVAGPKTSSSP